MIIKYSEWVRNRMMREQDEVPAETASNPKAAEFLGMEQKQGHKVYFGIHVLEQAIESREEGQDIKLSIDDIDPYCGQIISTYDDKRELLVMPPAKTGGIRSVKKAEMDVVIDGKPTKELLWRVGRKDLEDMTRFLSNPPADGVKYWIYISNAYQSKKVARYLGMLGGKSKPPTPEELGSRVQQARGLSDMFKPGPQPQEKIPSLEDLLGQTPEAPQPEAPSQQGYGSALFGPSKTLRPDGQPRPLDKFLKPQTPQAQFDAMFQQKKKPEGPLPNLQGMRNRRDVAWTDYGWNTLQETGYEQYPYFPE
jgi:hypothetical protein